MSLYDGFNGFQIGSGINALHQGMAARNGQVMQGLGNAMDSFVQNLQTANREKARKKSALDYLLGNGYTPEQAQQVTDTVGPEIVGQLMQRDWNKADLADERAYQEKMLKEKRDYESRVRGLQDRQAMLQSVLVKARDGRLPSQADIDEYNHYTKEYIDYVNKNPDLIGMMADFMIGNSPYANMKSYETWMGEVPNGENAEDFQKFKENAIASNVWASLMKDDDFAEKWNLALSKVSGDPTTRDALMLGSGKIATEHDAANKKAKEDFQRAVANAKKALEKEASKPLEEAALPKGITPAILKEIKKDKDAYRRYRALGGEG